mmetsp:Transcript_9382/g.14287  ORF Transcript_9382/g.14287 Transcript_9382/m.14287 type:complete len:154 (-) Transcript_9382:496-957(-)|eukprot:CAMPEP_0170500302 /NCGR_PEP_ID=MMETSP0208-20121228/34356_1 /TAXON_ID=197538 /ORGANISM="Strombidium inclinatum, Strain S3" /LENGTH=153 /DNA_ID=CAMNT_0010778267 /DNA_START=1644 /DNA_END=2105 /DNA_ORIENTATION=-
MLGERISELPSLALETFRRIVKYITEDGTNSEVEKLDIDLVIQVIDFGLKVKAHQMKKIDLLSGDLQDVFEQLFNYLLDWTYLQVTTSPSLSLVPKYLSVKHKIELAQKIKDSPDLTELATPKQHLLEDGADQEIEVDCIKMVALLAGSSGSD